MDLELNILVGERIKALRKAKKLDQETVASCCGLTRVSILNMEAGRQQLTAQMACRLATLFKCEYNDLFPPLSVHSAVLRDQALAKRAKLKAKIEHLQETLNRLQKGLQD